MTTTYNDILKAHALVAQGKLSQDDFDAMLLGIASEIQYCPNCQTHTKHTRTASGLWVCGCGTARVGVDVIEVME